MPYAEVAVDAPGGHRHTFTYSVPASLNIATGFGVRVPFGARQLQGIVTSLNDQSTVSETREISGTIAGFALVSADGIRLATWIADHYLSPIFSAISLMLPPGFERSQVVKPRRVTYLSIAPQQGLVAGTGDNLKGTRSFKQAELLEYLDQAGKWVRASQVRRDLNISRAVINSLLSKGIICEESVDVSRDPLAGREIPLEFPLTFTTGQQSAWDKIRASVTGSVAGANVFLLYGVTGSGKTEVYLQALEEVVSRGKTGICLVPEISLTPQMVDRFVRRFPGRVALLHSRLSVGEQFDIWHGIRNGHFDVVVGPRSAVFAPQPDIGLIIVDEEHEWAYKQSDKMPRYHARDVAVQLGKLVGATVILGSATPSVESYYKSRSLEYQMIELKERITPMGSTPLPKVTIVDMRKELKSGNRGMFSSLLKSRIALSLEQREQVILFINRRGSATFVECMNCGFVPGCRKCSASLTYHASLKKLLCHHCRRAYPLIRSCPHCSSTDMKYFGVGTETVEAECRKLFPSARTIRFDSDAVSKTREYEEVVNSFGKHEYDILIGTQVVAKGLNFPAVSLVGAVNADTSLNIPDFRAGERTFQLLCQVAGRAGRGTFAGTAVIQTFSPEYYAIQHAAKHDYDGFYEIEIKFRRSFGYPPFHEMARLAYSHTNIEKCQDEARRVSSTLKAEIASMGLPDFKLLGPVPGYISRLRGKYQMNITVLGNEVQKLLNRLDLPRGWILDVDPVGMI